ncbi:chromosome segregation protein SMC [Ferrimonas pelagia]|uniref:Chromosome partition protein Smc n=1 Tax=Ferrimonas pelagia TaxID=1177826 RepID=A0ABP9EW41_9GAMM
MRLKLIKLAGFKSFVDPTKVPFPDQMTAIVGPNGCGKSNVIDAVRWVLGESSAKNLRGDAMTDVIFNGSSGRKASSVASVELVFDNSEGRLQGQYNSYAEISVKRQVNSDAQSSYFLNGAKCRRRDITDLFMGTGLGPRSYAIIEQGTVSRLIESKPQELRVFIEEAAGISRYKERRRETENRIRHTRENLERLEDVRIELGSQIERLRRQADAARRYRELKITERTLQGELLALKWRELSAKMADLEGKIAELELQRTQQESAFAGDDAALIQLEQQKADISAELERCQQQLFQSSGAVTRLEQQILHARQRAQQLEEEIRRTREQLSGSEAQLQMLAEEQQALADSLAMLEPECETLAMQQEELECQLEVQEARVEQTQTSREQRRESREQAERARQVGLAELAGLGRERQQLASQQQRLSAQLTQWQPEAQADRLAELTEQHELAQLESEEAQEAAERATASWEQSEQARDTLRATLNEQQQQLSRTQGREQSLTTLIDARQLTLPAPFDALPRAWQQLTIEPEWASAVEQVLGHRIQGVIGAEHADLPPGLTRFRPEPAQPEAGARDWPRLLDRVQSPFNLSPWLSQIYCADSNAQAQQWLAQCRAEESVVLADGRWLGIGFEVSPGAADEKPLTALIGELEATELELERLRGSVASSQQQMAQAQQQIATDKELARTAQSQANRAREQALKLRGEVQRLSERLVQQAQQRELLTQQQEELTLRLEELEQRGFALEEQLEQQEIQADKASDALALLDSQLADQRQDLKQQQAQKAQLGQQLQQLQLQRQSQQARLQGMDERREQARLAASQWQERIEQAREEQVALAEPLVEFELELDSQLEARTEQESAQARLRDALAQIQQQLSGLTDNQRGQQQRIQALIDHINRHQLEHEGLRVQAQGQLDLLAEAETPLKGILENLSAEAAVAQWSADLERVKERIRRLGAINMAAIEEYDQQTERKRYLDEQDADLNQALEVLEAAIRKIDRETRSRFKDTFDKVNADLSMLFPKVFGGGSAYLALTGDDMLEAGVTIMARPPGKKNSTIHLLSGGEKALTALSLVFAIFRLNPAPFCMLDEVDAPLDDANVGRFCRLVKEMSETVQFVYISHNKVSMEMADRLTGVTMHEPGVSRIVAVDIEEAAAMATVG